MTPTITQNVVPYHAQTRRARARKHTWAGSYGRFKKSAVRKDYAGRGFPYVAERRQAAGFRRRERCSRYRQRGSISAAATALSLGLIAITSLAALAFFYLGQVQSTAAQGTDINELEGRLRELRERQRELELEGARLRSIQTIEEEAKKLNLTTADQFAYMSAPPKGAVTLAR